MTRAGNTYYYTFDGLGSVSELTDGSQNVVESYKYDAFGNLETPPATGNPYTYTAREYDSESGLYYYRARYYDPTTGRFITTDPTLSKNILIPYLLSSFLTNPGELNAYVYVSNNPINNIDPLGLRECCPGEKPKFHPGIFSICMLALPTMNQDVMIACAACVAPVPYSPWVRVVACAYCGARLAQFALACKEAATFCD
jgi:RHS repeat-associated protein